LALIVWTGYGLTARGEFLAAHRYLTGFAIDLFLDLLAARQLIGAQPASDLLDLRRRLEQLEPALAAEIRRIVSLPLSDAGRALLSLAERTLRPHAPEWPWDKVAVVQEWIL
jgi:hypothetical protein